MQFLQDIFLNFTIFLTILFGTSLNIFNTKFKIKQKQFLDTCSLFKTLNDKSFKVILFLDYSVLMFSIFVKNCLTQYLFIYS